MKNKFKLIPLLFVTAFFYSLSCQTNSTQMQNSFNSFKLNKTHFKIDSAQLSQLETAIFEYNNRVKVFEVSDENNYYRIDYNRVKFFIENASIIPNNLGEIDLTKGESMFNIGMPKIDIEKLTHVKWVKIYKDDPDAQFSVLLLPFEMQELIALENEKNEKIINLKSSIDQLISQENDLRAKRGNPEDLRAILSNLHRSKRELALCLKNLSYLSLLKIASNPNNPEYLKEYENRNSQFAKVGVMLFESMPN